MKNLTNLPKKFCEFPHWRSTSISQAKQRLTLLAHSTRTGMSNWRPAGRMRPLCLFCAARTVIFIKQQNKHFTYYFYFFLFLTCLTSNLFKKPYFKYLKCCIRSFSSSKFLKCGLLRILLAILRPFQLF